jgi:hypothetical protein
MRVKKFLNLVRVGVNHRFCRVHRVGFADMDGGDVIGIGFLPAVDDALFLCHSMPVECNIQVPQTFRRGLP